MSTEESGEPTPPADASRSESFADLAAEVEALRGQAARRHLLDLASGVVVQQLGMTPADAGEHLARLASATGLGVEELAADIVNQSAGITVAPGAPAQPPGAAEPRTRRLVLSAVEAAEDLQDVTATLLEDGLRPLGVEALMLWRRTATGMLDLVGHAGISPIETAHWQRVPPEWPTLLHSVTADSPALWLPNGPDAPEPVPGPRPDAARALVTLRYRATTVGLALVIWPGPAELDLSIRSRVTEMTEVAARIVDALTDSSPEAFREPVLAALLDLLTHPAMTVTTAQDTGSLRIGHLNPAALRAGFGVPRSVGRPVELVLPAAADELAELVGRARATRTPQRAHRLPAVPSAADDAALVNVRVLPIGDSRTVVLWHTGDGDRSVSVLHIAGRLGKLGTFEDDLARGTSRWSEQTYTIFGLPPDTQPIPLAQLRSLLHPGDRAELTGMLEDLAEFHQGRSTVVRALRGDGGLRHIRVVAEPVLNQGTLTGFTGLYQDVSAQHRTEVALAATFDQLTASQAEAALRHDLALRLQQAILPEVPDLQKLPGLRVAARYRPAAEEYRVGGDWHDVLRLPDGRILVVVGDVAGHGIDASTGMVALRNALRGLAFTGHSPRRLMGWLNDLTMHTYGHPTATAICALYEPDRRTLRWSSAGHLPPLLLREGRAHLLEPPHDILLGAVPSARYEERITQLRPGDSVLLYTDGLIERRHASLDDSLATLRRAAERLPSGAIDNQADRLLADAVGDTDDDTSLVLLRIV